MVGGSAAAEGRAARRQTFFPRLTSCFDKYNCCFLVAIDNVGAAQVAATRKRLRTIDAVMIFGKNTMFRKAMRSHVASNPKIEVLLPLTKGNMAFVFCHPQNMKDVKKMLQENRKSAPAKVGVISVVEVVVPAGPTGLEPTQTGFLQALNIATKINKGQIEIVKDVVLIKIGQKVGSSEAALLHKLNIMPFSYGLEIMTCFENGSVYDPKVLDLSDDDLVAKFQQGVRNVAAIGLATGIPNVASVPHSIINGYKNVLSVSVGTEYTFERAKKIKEIIKNPGKFVAAAPAAAPAAAAKKDDKKEEKKKEEEKKEESEGGDMGFGVFE